MASQAQVRDERAHHGDESLLHDLDQLIATQDPSTNPLIQAMTAGTLSRDDLRVFAAQFFHVVEAMPRMISCVHSVTPSLEHRRSLLHMLVAAELHDPTVADLWLRTCAALGASSDEIRSAHPTRATAACVGDFEYLCKQGSIQGIAALYAFLSALTPLCRVQQPALAQHYGVRSGPGVQYFEIVGFQAASHARALRRVLVQAVGDDTYAAAEATAAARAALVAFDGLHMYNAPSRRTTTR